MLKRTQKAHVTKENRDKLILSKLKPLWFKERHPESEKAIYRLRDIICKLCI